MPDARHEQLLHRILASRHFAHAESLKRILRYIIAKSKEGESSIREYDVAVQALGRPRSFDPKSDPIVRVSVAGIRQRLQSYFESEGSKETRRLEIPEGQFRATFREVAGGAGKRPATSATTRFWDPYITSGTDNILVYSEVLFFRDENYNYIRNIFVNDVATGQQQIQERLPEVDFDRFRPSFHFTSAGDMHCVLFLSKHFQDMERRLEVRNSRFASWNELRHCNLMFVGSSRTSKYIDSLQGEQPLVLTADAIRNRYPNQGEPVEYRRSQYLEGKLVRATEYAVITRQPGLSPNTFVTMISANHGRANEAAGLYVTREDALQRLIQKMALGPGDAFPARFQVLLQVELADLDEDVVNVEYVTHRLF